MEVKYCPYCGYKLHPKVYSDANTEKVCSLHGNIEELILKVDEPSWQDISKHADEFAKERGYDIITVNLCFEECAKFIAKYKQNGIR